MWPLLIDSPNFSLSTYTLCFCLAYFLLLGVWSFEGRRLGLDFSKLFNLSLGGFFASLAGARLLFLFVKAFADPAPQGAGGLVFLGGFLGGALFVYIATPRMALPRAAVFNSLAPALCFAQALGRVGCLASGCCYGKLCRFAWGIVFRNPLAEARPLGQPLHPTQLYEGLGLIVLGLLCLGQNHRAPKLPASAARIYLLGYGALRFGIEFFRGDLDRGLWGPLSTSQWIALGLMVVGLTIHPRPQTR